MTWLSMLALAALAVGCGFFGHGEGDRPHPPFPFAVSPVPGRVESLSSATLVMLRADNGRATVDMSAVPVPRHLDGIVQSVWRGDCVVRPGDDVLLSALDGRVLMLQRKKTERVAATDGRPFEPCVIQTYFDLTGIAPTQPWRERARGLGLALGGLASYGVPAHMYIRGDADTVLRGYREPSDVESAANRYGEARLAASARRVASKREELHGRTVLVEAIPYVYARESERPVGGWGYFVLRLFEDKGTKLVPHLDVASDASR